MHSGRHETEPTASRGCCGPFSYAPRAHTHRCNVIAQWGSAGCCSRLLQQPLMLLLWHACATLVLLVAGVQQLPLQLSHLQARRADQRESTATADSHPTCFSICVEQLPWQPAMRACPIRPPWHAALLPPEPPRQRLPCAGPLPRQPAAPARQQRNTAHSCTRTINAAPLCCAAFPYNISRQLWPHKVRPCWPGYARAPRPTPTGTPTRRLTPTWRSVVTSARMSASSCSFSTSDLMSCRSSRGCGWGAVCQAHRQRSGARYGGG